MVRPQTPGRPRAEPEAYAFGRCEAITNSCSAVGISRRFDHNSHYACLFYHERLAAAGISESTGMVGSLMRTH
ncbi:Uncharacterised protein [Arcanobacterium haemolyticum]|nr:Uncharacterised protein [Arcanobacterium haemolyticum]